MKKKIILLLVGVMALMPVEVLGQFCCLEHNSRCECDEGYRANEQQEELEKLNISNFEKEKNNEDRKFTIFCCLVTFILSLLSSWLIKKYDNSKLKKERKYNEFYRGFYIIWNKIHQGRAYNFTHLKKDDREKIVNFLIEHYYYAPPKLQNLIYNLETMRLNNFDNNDVRNKRICNQCYNEIIDYMIEKEQKLRKKYNNINY